MENNPAKKLIVGLDVSKEQALSLSKNLPDDVMVKIGLKLFNSYGPEIVKEIASMGRNIFLDLKFFDIPNQVADACEVACKLGVSMFNLHALGGAEMIKKSRERINDWAEKTGGEKPKLLGVTILTSFDTDSLNEIGIPDSNIETAVKRLAEIALKNGCDGLVCSAKELTMLRETFGNEFLAVTPGIRRKTDNLGDQKRVMTPGLAIKSGASHIVVGRPIYQSNDPANEAKQIIEEMENAK
ncbi:MAG: orotidine-5'-phosphate decarboxylase [Caldisericia bacterium]|nr:orotidine-5'-phosphate decarboxylase [Caldisericia bacterium]